MRTSNGQELTPEERAAVGLYLSRADFDTLAGVVAGLKQKYPDDWYARTSMMTGMIFAGALGCIAAFAGAKWWVAVLPTAIYFAVVLLLLWRIGRVPGVPRWVHREARLTQASITAVAEVASRLKPVQQGMIRGLTPCTSGYQFWGIWSAAQDWVRGHT